MRLREHAFLRDEAAALHYIRRCRRAGSRRRIRGRHLMADKTYDAIVIGGGTGGYPCAIRLGQLKQKVVLIDKDELGGGCLNWGCIPSKALISASHTYEKAKMGASIGLMSDNVRMDVPKMQDWKAGIVKKLTTGVRGLLKGN